MPLRAWKTSVPTRRRLGKRRSAGRDDHELLEVDRVVGVRAAVQDVHHRHGQNGGRARARERRRRTRRAAGPASAAEARAAASETPRIAFAPRRDLFGVPSRSIIACRATPDPTRRRPMSASAISPFAFATALETPLPSHSEPPSRSSVASNSPVEAPDGTAARPSLRPKRGSRRPRPWDCPWSRGSGALGCVRSRPCERTPRGAGMRARGAAEDSSSAASSRFFPARRGSHGQLRVHAQAPRDPDELEEDLAEPPLGTVARLRILRRRRAGVRVGAAQDLPRVEQPGQVLRHVGERVRARRGPRPRA